jgi:hypothetical protein
MVRQRRLTVELPLEIQLVEDGSAERFAQISEPVNRGNGEPRDRSLLHGLARVEEPHEVLFEAVTVAVGCCT